jgi:DNA-binding transcriptional regulator YiaG
MQDPRQARFESQPRAALDSAKESPHVRGMTPRQFREGLEKLGLSVNDFARIVGVNSRNVARYCDDRGDGPSPPAAFALKGMIRNHIPADASGMISAIYSRIESIIEDAERSGHSRAAAIMRAMDAVQMLYQQEREG